MLEMYLNVPFHVVWVIFFLYFKGLKINLCIRAVDFMYFYSNYIINVVTGMT